jgi:hypothetical protein
MVDFLDCLRRELTDQQIGLGGSAVCGDKPAARGGLCPEVRLKRMYGNQLALWSSRLHGHVSGRAGMPERTSHTR